MVSNSCLVSFPYYREMIPTSPIFVIFSTNHHFFERFFFWLQQHTTKNRVAFGMIFLWCVGWWRCYSRCLPPWGFLEFHRIYRRSHGNPFNGQKQNPRDTWALQNPGISNFLKWEKSAAFFQAYHKKRLVKQYFLARNLWTKKFFFGIQATADGKTHSAS